MAGLSHSWALSTLIVSQFQFSERIPPLAAQAECAIYLDFAGDI